MGDNDEIGGIPQRGVRGQRLRLKHVQNRAGERALLELLAQCGVVHDGRAADVDEAGLGLEEVEAGAIEKIPRSGVSGAVTITKSALGSTRSIRLTGKTASAGRTALPLRVTAITFAPSFFAARPAARPRSPKPMTTAVLPATGVV